MSVKEQKSPNTSEQPLQITVVFIDMFSWFISKMDPFTITVLAISQVTVLLEDLCSELNVSLTNIVLGLLLLETSSKPRSTAMSPLSRENSDYPSINHKFKTKNKVLFH